MAYLESNRDALLSIFGQIQSGRCLELLVNAKLTEEDLDRACCLNTIEVHKYDSGEVEFPLRKRQHALGRDKELATELYAIILCEQAVREGLLVRDGYRYCPIDMSKISEPARFGKYLINQQN